MITLHRGRVRLYHQGLNSIVEHWDSRLVSWRSGWGKYSRTTLTPVEQAQVDAWYERKHHPRIGGAR